MPRGKEYLRVHRPNGERVDLHILVVEQVLGRHLPPGAVVHHVNEVTTDNRPANLCVLQNNGEHMALHRRLRVLQAGGNPWTQHLCGDCHHPCDGREGRCKDCRGEKHQGYMRAYYLTVQKPWRQSHREARNARRRQWHADHREAMNARRRYLRATTRFPLTTTGIAL